jgi:HAMP domain.
MSRNGASRTDFRGDASGEISTQVVICNILISKENVADATSTSDSARLWIYIAIVLAAALCVAAGLALVRAISKPLNTMTDAMGELARGNCDG